MRVFILGYNAEMLRVPRTILEVDRYLLSVTSTPKLIRDTNDQEPGFSTIYAERKLSIRWHEICGLQTTENFSPFGMLVLPKVVSRA